MRVRRNDQGALLSEPVACFLDKVTNEPRVFGKLASVVGEDRVAQVVFGPRLLETRSFADWYLNSADVSDAKEIVWMVVQRQANLKHVPMITRGTTHRT